MRKPHLVYTAGFALVLTLRGGLSEAQAPHCADTSATVQEDTTLEVPLACVEGGHLVGLDVGYVRTVAGNQVGGWTGDGGAATAASLNLPHGIAVDGAGNLYIADSFNHVIRRVDGATGIITTIAGSGLAGFGGDGGLATQALLDDPRWVGVDAVGNVFVNDVNNARVRRVDVETGIITTVAGGGAGGAAEGVAGIEAGLIALGGIAFDAAGDLFIVETGRNRIRRVSRGADGLVTGTVDEIIVTVAGAGIQGLSGDGGPALAARFSAPQDLAFDLQGNLFVADSSNHRIRRVAAGGNGLIDGAADEIVTTVAGGGAAPGDGVLATTIALNLPRGVTVDRFGNIFISEAGALKVRRVDALTGIISTIVGGSALGEDILALTARTFNPRALDTDAEGNLFIAELGAHRIRAVRLIPVALTYDLVDPPANGTATVTMDGTLTYVPSSNFAGVDQLTFRALNSVGQPSNTATLNVTVTPVDDPPVLAAHVQQPIDADGSSLFTARRGAIPVKFTLSIDGQPTCDLPPASIAVTRTTGAAPGTVNEGEFILPSDAGANFRIDDCTYVYNLAARALGQGTYSVEIRIGSVVVGSATFGLQ